MPKGNDNSAGKRPSSRNTKPYDANNSFVRKVATKVTDFIQPSWLSKWFNTSQSNEDRENIEEETEDDTQQGPPSKRSCIRMDMTHPPGTFSIQKRVKTALNTVDLSKEQYPVHEMLADFPEPATAGPSGISRLISSTPATQSDVKTVTSHRSDLNSLTSPTNNGIGNGTDDNSESSESTSGCSSLIPQINRHEGPSNLLYSSFSNRKRHIDDKLTFTNHLQSPRSLFLDSNFRDTLSSRRPSFNASVMTDTLNRASPLSSPFYSGNITFGGANTAGLFKHGRDFNNSIELQLKVPRRTNIEVKTSNTAGVDSSGMSQTAKKILEALEHFSSPISDAKKIPLKHTSNVASSIMSRKRVREEVATPSARIGLRHLTRELIVPTVPDILKLKRRDKLQDTTVAARKIVSARSDPPPQEYQLRKEDGKNEKYRGKLKGKSKINLEEEETVQPVNLPNIPLPITTLPNFNFILPSANSTVIANKENTFTFASPIRVMDTGKSLQSVNNFTFSNPIDAEDANNITDPSSSLIMETKESTGFPADHVTTSMPNFIWSGSSTAPRLKAKVKSKDNVGFTATCELESGSVIDILCPTNVESNLIEQSNSKLTSEITNTNKIATIVSSDSDNKSTHTELFWECSNCMIRNNDTNKHCIACKVARQNPDAKTPPPLTQTIKKVASQSKSTADDFGAQFKLCMNQWKCTICSVRNKRTDAKCVACSAPRPKNQTLQQIIEAQKSDPMEKKKPVEGSWECSGCLLKNATDVFKCPCCNTSKPITLKTSSKKRDVIVESSAEKLNILSTSTESITQSTTTSTSDIMNKFKPNKDSWECPGCLVRNNSSVTACPCCSTAKPCSDVGTNKAAEQKTSTNGFGDKFKKPEGAWNCDSCLLQNDAKHTQCVACEASKPGTTKSNKSTSNTTSVMQFKFGVLSNTSDSTNQLGGFKFGIDKTDQSKSDTASPLNGFKFGSAQPISDTVQFTFGIPKEQNKDKTANKDEASKTSSIASSSNTGFLFNVKNPEKSESTDQKTKHETSLSVSQNVTSTAGEKSDTSTVLATSTPLFMFGAQKSGFNQPVSNLQTQKTSSAINITDNSKSVAAITTATITTISSSTVVTTSINSIPISTATVLPSLPTSKANSDVEPPVFSFGATKSMSTAANNTSTNTMTTCLPAFAQHSFTFSDSKIASQVAPVPTFSQIPTSSTALPTKLFGENKIPDTSISSSNKPVSVAATDHNTIFPVISNSTSLFSNNNESKTTTAFGMNKPLAFPITNKPSSGFAMSESKIPTFGGSSSTENKSSIFGSLETTKLPGFNSPTQTSVANSLPSFGTLSNATPSLFGSSNAPAFGNNSASTFNCITTSSPMFSSTKTSSETTNVTKTSNPSLFTFGSSSQQSTSGGFNFSANTNATESGAKPLFTFGNGGANTPQSNNVFGTFGASTNASTNATNFAFNPAKQETPTAFAQSTVTTPIFGASQATPQTQATPSFTSTSSSNAGFNFGSAAPPATTAGSFNFGGMPSTSTSTGGFNFNPPTSTSAMGFDPNSKPSFNFTKGSAPTSFNAPPQSAATPRKIKKAFRRCMR